VCGIEFDRRDIAMNKMIATTLESKFYVFDVRTQHPKKGFSYLMEKVSQNIRYIFKHSFISYFTSFKLDIGKLQDLGSSVSIVSDYGLDSWVSITVGDIRFFL
jgi:hypothetical protein